MTEHDAIRIISHLFSITPMFYVAVTGLSLSRSQDQTTDLT